MVTVTSNEKKRALIGSRPTTVHIDLNLLHRFHQHKAERWREGVTLKQAINEGLECWLDTRNRKDE